MPRNGASSRPADSRSNPNPNPNPDANAAGGGNPKPAKNPSSNPAAKKKPPQPQGASTSVALNESRPKGPSPPPELSGTGSEETDLSSSEGDDSTWISWFCGLRGNELLCEVDEDYIQDDFNLCGLQGLVPYYDYALDMILDSDSFSGELDGEEHSEIESAAELLYGLIHARYIVTSKGLNAMHDKYKRADFGRCPRVFCGGQPCLPVGSSDIPHSGSVKIYCPKCEDLYFPRCKYQSNMDGAYLGTTFPHLFLMTYPSAKPAKPVQGYVPRVFGFKLHEKPR
ncbi:hypothetical protein MRB53_027788 [Persea americana]|uniref:Uncharacterized protein n=1 Tax=Persea americana TaxID=3435 RepID=A0ACC2LLW0_PERAE|nr:hypothetical protein MRB53_027788 [Persea americana]|eukprot:TRINITY_DN7105_c0_g2_i1.p1 TRINITY_DN7105_c0_g2~~TRINITY_DN7105_c0_g2_i1.p1  ORF type:complete len:283 (+),score=39.06 TRINITY_DN7105_c0_g2_i1:223-1071(+)